MKEGRKPKYPEKTPGDELQKMPHTIARRFKPQTGFQAILRNGCSILKKEIETETVSCNFNDQRRDHADSNSEVGLPPSNLDLTNASVTSGKVTN